MVNFWQTLPAEIAHDLAPVGLQLYCELSELWAKVSRRPFAAPEWQPRTWEGLHFANPLGIAGGVDKIGEQICSWERLGVGFVEIGTVTPLAQSRNVGRVLDRDFDSKNLWNKMGFPSPGATEVWAAISAEIFKSKRLVPRFVNIGKNRRTALAESVTDYLQCCEQLRDVADAFVINVSSPNTAGLRDLQAPQALNTLCRQIVNANSQPILLKLSPDLGRDDLRACLDVAVRANIAGFVLTNTTTDRPANCKFPAEGGLSGAGLRDKSLEALRTATEFLVSDRSRFLLVSVGGVSTLADVQERLRLGADLIQVYSALVFQGPGFFRQLAKEHYGR